MNPYFQLAIRNQLSSFCQKQWTTSAYRKYIAYIIFPLISFFFGVYPTQAAKEEGYVITTANGEIYLNLGEKHGIEEGTLFRVYRPLFNIYRPAENPRVNIAQIKVIQVYSESSVASILSHEKDMAIMGGDRIEIIQPKKTYAFSLPQDKESGDQLATPKSPTNKIHWLLLNTGIVVLGSAGYFRQLADKAYIQYKQANGLDETLLHRKNTQLNDKRTKIALSVSLALISISAYLWQGDTVKTHDSFIRFWVSNLKPQVNYSAISWQVEF